MGSFEKIRFYAKWMIMKTITMKNNDDIKKLLWSSLFVRLYDLYCVPGVAIVEDDAFEVGVLSRGFLNDLLGIVTDADLFNGLDGTRHMNVDKECFVRLKMKHDGPRKHPKRRNFNSSSIYIYIIKFGMVSGFDQKYQNRRFFSLVIWLFRAFTF